MGDLEDDLLGLNLGTEQDAACAQHTQHLLDFHDVSLLSWQRHAAGCLPVRSAAGPAGRQPGGRTMTALPRTPAQGASIAVTRFSIVPKMLLPSASNISTRTTSPSRMKGVAGLPCSMVS